MKSPLSEAPRKPRSFLSLLRVLLALLLASGGLAVMATPAHALGNDYPWQGESMSQYSPLGFAYRNCTDYAAWTLNTQKGGTTQNIKFKWSDIQSNNSGHARDWKQGAINRGKTVDGNPAIGAVAWWGSGFGGGYGHVAIVADYGPTWAKLHEYNHNYQGTYNERVVHRNTSAWPQAFLHIADIPPPPPPVIDSDGDGFNDDVDQCPHTWGKWRGCPQRSDFNNDGRAEVAAFYRHDGNLTDLNLWNGLPGASTSLPYRPWSGTGWDGTRLKSAGSGNFNGDRYQDTASFYMHDGGMVDLNIWFGDANGGLNQGQGWHAPSGWEADRLKPAGAADFNKDGRTDVAAFYTHNGFSTLLIWFGQANGEMHLYTAWTGNGWDGNRIVTVGSGDVDGDSKNDIATFYRHDNGMVDYNVWYSTGSGNVVDMFTLGRPWHRASGWDVSRFVPGGLHDLNNDGRAEAIVFYNHPGGNLVDMRTWPGTANRVISGEPGGPWSASNWDGSRIIPAGTDDYNGDGAADVATFYRHDGQAVDMNVWYGNGTGALTLERPWTTATGWEGARLIPAKG